MAEYVVTPVKKELPEGPYLMDELHRRGFPVEINLKGTAQNWDAIRFYEPGPPEIECFLSREENEGKFNVSLAADSPSEASELQLNLIDILLSGLGGQADNSATRERFGPGEFSAFLKSRRGNSRELFWIGFSWLVVAAGISLWIFSPATRVIAPAVVFLSLISAAGLTYSHFKT